MTPSSQAAVASEHAAPRPPAESLSAATSPSARSGAPDALRAGRQARRAVLRLPGRAPGPRDSLQSRKHLTMRVSMARFPFQKTLDAFDFKFQPSIDPKVIRELATGRYLETGDNVLLLGPPGVGKTHLAVALGLKACEHGVRVLFTTAAGLIATLGKALAEGRLDERLKVLAQP